MFFLYFMYTSFLSVLNRPIVMSCNVFADEVEQLGDDLDEAATEIEDDWMSVIVEMSPVKLCSLKWMLWRYALL